MIAFDGDEEDFMVVDKATTVVVWEFKHAPSVYRELVKLPESDRAKAFIALVPPNFEGDVRHITKDPYFAEHHLDVYTLTDNSKLYVGS